ncbi:rhodanese-related sulfurtransferase [Pleurocapsales cyanobacterium LEGE 06147]|nr:rhodanese-related sulfurtransferase [Pleurocapsales cyanobacterium LEGE 06147]
MSFSYSAIPEISVEELSQYLARGDKIQLIDVREPHEIEIAYIEGFEVLPLSQFSEWTDQIVTRFNPEVETLVMCHHGIRSAQMCQWLIGIGFTNVKNIAGGIDAYSLKIDPSMARY